MKDIDFDELDRAVSSVLSTGPKTPSVPETAPAVPVSPSAPSNVPAATAPTIFPVNNLNRDASPAVRRGGRFMDVVHPSSDMKSPTAPVARVSKRTLGPISDDLKNTDVPEPISSTPLEVAVEPTVTEPFPTLDTLPADSTPRIDEVAEPPQTPDVAAEPARDQEQQEVTAPVEAVAWPDPLDVQTDTEQQPVDVPDDQEQEDGTPEAVEEVPTEQTGSNVPEESAQTPFLTDTKVDKRPLGAFAGAPTDAQEGAASFNPTNNAASLSPELDSNLVQIESNEIAIPDTKSPETTENTPRSATTDTEATSIPQQYNLEEKLVDSDAHAIFDTSTYHQPLLPQKTHRKSHVWVWLLLIFGLLIVGGGLGALFFMAGF